MPMFSSRTRWNLKKNKISLTLNRLRAKGEKILDLTQSNPTACGIEYPPFILDALSNPSNLRYDPAPLGNKNARKAVAACYSRPGIAVHPDDLVLTASTSEAYSFVMRCLADPQDRILFPRPSYPLLDHLAQINDVGIDRYLLRYDGFWQIDFDSLEKGVTPRTRAIVLVNPNNPTGSFIKIWERERLLRICSRHRLALISDEVFADYAFARDGQRVRSIAEGNKILTFSLGGISKMLGLPQMKLSWICVSGPAGQKKQALERLEMIADTYLSVNTPVQHALGRWLKSCRKIQRQIQTRVQQNLAFLKAQPWCGRGCEVLNAEGGWYAVLRIPAVRSEEEWVLEILRQKKVLVHPGYFFDFEKEAYLVLSLLPPPAEFSNAIKRIKN